MFMEFYLVFETKHYRKKKLYNIFQVEIRKLYTRKFFILIHLFTDDLFF